MRITEITENITNLPDEKGMDKLKRILSQPLTPEEAKAQILPYFNTPLLRELLDSLAKHEPKCDARQHFADYLKAEYPQIAHSFMKLNMLRDENIDGTLSPLGHKDEEA